MLDIRLFGSGQIKFTGQPLNGFPFQQPCMLLAYLILNAKYPHPREHLASILWTDYSTQASRKALRNALWRLRQAFDSIGTTLDDYLLITEDYVSFIHASRHRLDIEIFEDTLRITKDLAISDLTKEQVSQLETAVELYVGDLLEGTYEDWVLYDRERLRLSYLNALSNLMLYYGFTGDHEKGISCGERILVHDNTHEKIHRQMMWLFALKGDRVAVDKQYRRCCQMLRDELGIGPMPETRQFYEKLSHNQVNPNIWPDDFEKITPASKNLKPIPNMDKHILVELHRLQGMIEATQATSRLIERLISESMNN